MSEWETQTLKPEQFKIFRDYIHANSGIYLDDYKKDALEVSLRALMRQLDKDSFSDYFMHLESGGDDKEEFKKLLDLITVNETCFFRNPTQFDAFRTHIIPELVKKKQASGERSIRIWTAGCSTGEEPYSVAITLLESLPDPESWIIDILATDISRQVLADAQRACYGKHALREMSTHYLHRYFKPQHDGQFCLDRKIVNMVSFNYHNLVTEPYPVLILGGWDVIFCRNVTIYFKLETVRDVIGGFYNALHDGGYLLIGHAESLYKVNEEFIPVHIGHTYAYKKDVAARAAASEAGMAPIILKKPVAENRMPKKTKQDKEPLKRIKAATSKTRQEFRREEDREGLYARAYEHFIKEEFDEAAVLANRYTKLDPGNPLGHVLSANIYLNQGRIERALKETRVVIDNDPMSAKGHYLMGLIKERQGRVDDAVSEYKQVLRFDSGFALAHMNLANIYRAKHLEADAIREYNSAIATLDRAPRGDWADFAGGFLGNVLVEACRRSLGQLENKK